MIKKRFSPIFYSFLFAAASITCLPKITLAQLRLGTGIQPGLEGYFLEYQQRGLPLERIRGINNCSVGFGASCNKTGAILQQIVKEYSGLSYQDLVVKSAGGQANYQRFIQLYSNPSAVKIIPYSSFWRDPEDSILDSYKNSGIGILSDTKSSGLYEIVRQFKYAPVIGDSTEISLRQGLVGLKTSYGLTLIEEASKVPGVNQKIAELSLSNSEASFHQNQFQQAVTALNNQSFEQFNNALFYVISNPYTEDNAPLNRPNLQIAQNLAGIEGITLAGETETILGVTGEGMETFLINDFGEIIEGANSTPFYAIAGIGGITLLILQLTGATGDSEGNNAVSSDDNLFDPIDIPIGGGENQVITPGEEVALEVPEPSNMTTFLLLSGIFLLLGKKVKMG